MLRILINKQTYQLVMTAVMKNCDPLVSGPAFAIDRTPVQGVKKEEWVHCPALPRSFSKAQKNTNKIIREIYLVQCASV